jgi:hypothetical protein
MASQGLAAPTSPARSLAPGSPTDINFSSSRPFQVYIWLEKCSEGALLLSSDSVKQTEPIRCLMLHTLASSGLLS